MNYGNIKDFDIQNKIIVNEMQGLYSNDTNRNYEN